VYSGDLRWHGSAAEETKRFIHEAALLKPRLLLCEGTRIPKDYEASEAELQNHTERDVFDRALQVVRAWGFEPATMLTWVKPQMGIGRWFRSASEYILFCTRDGLPLTVQDKAYRNWFEADRGKHSQKPDTFYELVQTVSPGPYLDLFGRSKRDGWEVWGDEA
ncbi:hypothetical protein LCGC14_2093280, partial [marine sediment metagenome]